MNKSPCYWLVNDNQPWHALQNALIGRGCSLTERWNDVNLTNIHHPVLFTDKSNSILDLKSHSIYKIFLAESKSKLCVVNNLIDFDEILFTVDLLDSQIQNRLDRTFLHAQTKTLAALEKQTQIKTLKKQESELQRILLEHRSLQTHIQQENQALNFELQKSHSLLKFILLLSREMELNNILGQIWKDLMQIRGTLNIFLIQAQENNQYRFYFKSQSIFLYKIISLDKVSDEASFNTAAWSEIISKHSHPDAENIFSFPLHKYFKNKQTYKKTVLLLEHKFENEEHTNTIKYISERLPFISMAIEKSRTSDQLITKNRLWENTFDGITDPLIIVDSNYKVVRSNQAFTGQSIVKICYVSFSGHKTPCENCPLPKGNIDNQHENVQTSELYFMSKIFLVHSYPLSKAYSNRYYINYYSEVSKERELLVKTIHFEKMRSLDSFADQLSTNLRKPLQAIKDCFQKNTQLLSLPDAIEIKKAVLRSESILTNLSEFAKGNPNLIKANIDPLIESTLPFFKSLARKHKIYMHLESKDFAAYISPSLFQQVIFNLVNNACQAMPTPGTVTITSKAHSLNGNRGIRIEISDTGPGIPEHLRQNLFKSAFTTKDIKKGTGLGLKICQFVINSFQGFIEYQALPMGTKFWIWIPESNSDNF
jgi:hypothetical protein